MTTGGTKFEKLSRGLKTKKKELSSQSKFCRLCRAPDKLNVSSIARRKGAKQCVSRAKHRRPSVENVGLQWQSEISFWTWFSAACGERKRKKKKEKRKADHVGSGRDVNRLHRAVWLFQARSVVQTPFQITSGGSFNPNLFCSSVLCLVGRLLLVCTPPFLSLLRSCFDFPPLARLGER